MSERYDESLSAPKGGAFAITPHDTNELAKGATAIYVGNGGNLKVTTSRGDTVTFVGCVTGTIIPVRAKLVFSTGTTASNLIGLY